MRNKSIFIFLMMIFLASCAAPTVTPQTLEVSETSKVLTATPTSTQTAIPTLTQTPEPALPAYGEIDPNVADKLKAEGINIPEELLDPEYKLDLATELQKTEWGNAYGLEIPITVIPEKGIAYGKYHIKGIGATQEAWDEYAKQHIKYMWIHYREFGNEADREITLEQYVELLKQGRGGFEIPQYNPETGFFDAEKKTINPLAGYAKVISDSKELPLKRSTENSYLFYVDANGMVWAVGNDLEYMIEQWLNPDDKSPYKEKTYEQGPNLAYGLLSATYSLGIIKNECLATDVAVASCLRDSAKVEKKYWDTSVGLAPLYKEWLAKYEAGDHSAKPPWWIDD